MEVGGRNRRWVWKGRRGRGEGRWGSERKMEEGEGESGEKEEGKENRDRKVNG